MTLLRRRAVRLRRQLRRHPGDAHPPYDTTSLLGSPSSLAVGPDGDLYVSNQASGSNPNESILKYDLDTLTLSTFISTAQLQASRAATFNTTDPFAPSGLTFGPDGDLYVVRNAGQSATGPGGVLRFDVAGGAYAGTFANVLDFLVSPSAVTFGVGADTTSLYVSSSDPIIFGGNVVGFSGRVTKVADAGTAPTPSTFIAPGAGNLSFASGIRFGPDGGFYVADLAALEEFVPTSPKGRVVRFDGDGTNPVDFTPAAGNPGSLSLQFPSGVIFDDTGRLIVGALGPKRPPATEGGIYRYTAAGAFDTKLVSSTSFPNTGTTGGGQQESGVTTSQIVLVAGAGLSVFGRVSPGGDGAVGTLTVPALTLASTTTYTFEAGAGGADRITSTGAVTLNDAIPSLSLGGFVVPAGTTYTILSGTAVTGTFAGLPNNTVFTDGGQEFRINYTATAVTLKRVLSPQVSSAGAATFYTGRNNAFTATATGSPTITYALGGDPLTGTLTFDTATGVLSGTPAAPGTLNFTVTATWSEVGTTPDTEPLTVTVLAGVAPVITTANNAAFVQGVGGTFDVDASGTPAPTTFGLIGAPAGVTINPTTGDITVAATVASNVYAFTVTADNGVAPQGTQGFTLTVGTTPVFSSANSATFYTNFNNGFTVAATGSPTPTLGITGSLPTGVTFNPANGFLAGTPAAGTQGTYNLTFTATNAVGTVNQPFTLTVQVGASPVITTASTLLVGPAGGTLDVDATGNPTPTYSLTGAPAG